MYIYKEVYFKIKNLEYIFYYKIRFVENFKVVWEIKVEGLVIMLNNILGLVVYDNGMDLLFCLIWNYLVLGCVLGIVR